MRQVKGSGTATAYIALMAAMMLVEAPAGAAAVQELHLPAAPLDEALRNYARQTGRQMFYPSALVAGRRSPALSGRLDPDEALRDMLRGTPIAVVRADSHMVVLAERAAAPTQAKAAASRPTPRPRRSHHIGDDAIPQPDRALDDAATIIVTGSNIRGQAAISPVMTLDRDALDRGGFSSVAEAVAALPQNFGGTATEDSLATATDRTIQNTGFGSGVNLRGLGSDATLALINGRRAAGSGGKGDFTDLSSVPLGAIARIEVLTDGASAIYGSDAVGGVVNMILRKDFDGAETRARLGSVTRGTSRDVQLGQLAGTHWATGHILFSYEYARRTRLRSADRRYTATSDLRGLGGSDYRTTFSMPGTVLRFDPTLATYVPAFAIPDGQDGTRLTRDSFTPGANYTNQREGTDILPGQTRHNVYGYAEQEAGSALTLFAESRYAHRNFSLNSPAALTIIPVSRANPYFISPTGAASDLIGYSLGRELGPVRNIGTVETWSAATGGTLRLGGDWIADLSLARASETTDLRTDHFANTSYLYEAAGALPDNPATAFSTARDGYFNPYGSGASNSAAMLDFIGAGYTQEHDRSRLDDAGLKLDGSLAALPGGLLRLAVGANVRHEHFERAGKTFYDGTVPQPLSPTDDGRTVTAAFAELSLPLFGADNARPGLHQLQLTAAVRREHYSDFGNTTNPKLGALWAPVEGLILRASWGTSFRAPAIKEVTDPLRASTSQFVNASGGRTPVLTLSGGNPDLKPEKARSWSAGVKWSPKALPIKVEATWFRTSFRDRIGRPAYEDFTRTLTDPTYSPFVTLVDPVNNAADLALLQALLATPGAAISLLQPVTTLRAIVDGRYVNTARTVVQGIDLLASGSFDLGSGKATVSANASWLLDYKTQVTPTARLRERVAKVGNPSDLRARSSLSWDGKNVGGTLTLNYVHGYQDDISVPARHVAAWTTLDAQLRYSPQGPGWADGLTLSLSVTNLLATDPTFVNSAYGIGYDPANADPLGRFAALQVTKRW